MDRLCIYFLLFSLVVLLAIYTDSKSTKMPTDVDEGTDDNEEEDAEEKDDHTSSKLNSSSSKLERNNQSMSGSKKATNTTNLMTTTLPQTTDSPTTPTTTTKKPTIKYTMKCPEYSCPYTQGNVSLPPEAANIRGQNLSVCGKRYFKSERPALDASNAREQCCQMGMYLASLETLEEYHCVTNALMGSSRWFYIWTSGTRIGKLKSNLQWCGNVQVPISMAQSFWPKDEPSNQQNERCVALRVELIKGLDNLLCEDTNLPFLCEDNGTNVYDPKEKKNNQPLGIICPAENCTKNWNESAIAKSDPEKLGKVVVICGKAFFLMKQKMTGTEARTQCCNLGMWPLSVENQRQRDCVLDFFKQFGADSCVWTSAIREPNIFSAANYHWCTDTKTVVDLKLFHLNEPNTDGGVELCVSLESGGKILRGGLNDHACWNSYTVLCELPISVATNPPVIITQPPLIPRTKKKHESTIAGQATKKTESTQQQSCPTLSANCKNANADKKKEANIGRILDACNSSYIIGNSSLVSYNEAENLCCSVGQKLVNINSITEQQCLHDILKGVLSRSHIYWVGGRRPEGSPDSWCSSGTPYIPKDLTWQPGEPYNWGGKEECLTLNFHPKLTISELSDAPCTNLYLFLCKRTL